MLGLVEHCVRSLVAFVCKGMCIIAFIALLGRIKTGQYPVKAPRRLVASACGGLKSRKKCARVVGSVIVSKQQANYTHVLA